MEQNNRFKLIKRCAELLNLPFKENLTVGTVSVANETFNPTVCPTDCWQIIEHEWETLMLFPFKNNYTRWEVIMQTHKCIKLEAACISFVEMSDKTPWKAEV